MAKETKAATEAKTAPAEAKKAAKMDVPEGFESTSGNDTPYYLMREAGASLRGIYLGRFLRNTKGITKISYVHQFELTKTCEYVYQFLEGGEVVESEQPPGEIVNVWETTQIRNELSAVPHGSEVFIGIKEKKILENGQTFWSHMIATKKAG